jgi:hypothetical protein
LAMYGITIGIPQFVLMLLANIKTATQSKHGHEFRLAMHAILSTRTITCTMRHHSKPF